jgi:hypothetical protein
MVSAKLVSAHPGGVIGANDKSGSPNYLGAAGDNGLFLSAGFKRMRLEAITNDLNNGLGIVSAL